mgnify:CR=1 FL=1
MGISDVPIVVLTLSPKPGARGEWTEQALHALATRLRTEVAKVDDVGLTFIDFLQLRAEAGLVRSFGRRHRVLLRAEAGTTVSQDFADFPPSLRFYAGGDRSVRGYGYKEIGQYLEDASGNRYVFGGKHLVVASVEFERMFTREWGGAVFVDAGDAFDDFESDAFEMQLGVGVGVRWRSPVGPVRLDLAHGLGDDAQDSIRLHLTIGPDL